VTTRSAEETERIGRRLREAERRRDILDLTVEPIEAAASGGGARFAFRWTATTTALGDAVVDSAMTAGSGR
jgi:hypothetical protein